MDGIRGLAVAGVFLFHAGVGWASGGFLGVSVFFTLSGFLITTLLLNEGLATHAIDVFRFWSRRFRRLLPAALLTVVLVLALSATVLRIDPSSLRGDALAAIAYVANWHVLFTGQSYAALFRDPSPLLHFWSLAIEEQFYLLFPLLLLLIRRTSTSPRAFRLRLRFVLCCGLAISALTSVVAGAVGATDFVYYSLPTRGGEILVGALIATSVSGAHLMDERRSTWPIVVGVAALGAIAYLGATTTSTSGWVTDGGLTLFALLSGALLVSALPTGPFATALALPPLRWLGRISYGVYLYHWPIILWLTRSRVGLAGWPLIGVQAAATLAAATLSYQFVELPIRQGHAIRGPRARLAIPVALVVAAALTVWTTASLTQPPLIDLARTAAALQTADPGSTRASTRGHGAVAPAATIEVVGDSTGLATTFGLNAWATATHKMNVLVWSTNGDRWLGCGIIPVGLVRYDGTVLPAQHNCGDRNVAWAQALDVAHPNAVVLQFGPFDVADHLLPGDITWRAPGDPIYDQQLFAAMTALADISLQRGIPTIWLTSPDIDTSHVVAPPGTPLPQGDPARMQRLNHLLRMVASQHPSVRIIDLAEWVKHRPGGEFDTALRPDGVHFSDQSARTVANWLAPAILRTLRPTRHGAGS